MMIGYSQPIKKLSILTILEKINNPKEHEQYKIHKILTYKIKFNSPYFSNISEYMHVY